MCGDAFPPDYAAVTPLCRFNLITHFLATGFCSYAFNNEQLEVIS